MSAERRPIGRPTKYRPEFAERALRLCFLGLTDEELARQFGIHRDNLHEWTRRFPEFHDAITRGRVQADAHVAAALYKRACGYDIERTKLTKAGEVVTFTEHIPADFNAMSLWLRNRQPERWREKTIVEHDISDRVAERLEAARLRSVNVIEAPVIDVETIATDQR